MNNGLTIIGVMGPGKTATAHERSIAEQLGRHIASEGWVVLTGGLNQGVMDAACKGARSIQGLTIGIIPRRDSAISRWVDIPIITDMGSSRNVINALSCYAMIVIGMTPGTATEATFALQRKKHVIFIRATKETKAFFMKLGHRQTHFVATPERAIMTIKKIV